ncbi:MAG TPA: ParB/RepB/Spo0J family partition protein [Pseudomonas sp.]|jgi:hypothetical protein|uniref:ParB/RepB/Spo0J family partition protein n=1 Tax=Pseudomonas sp. TaxID=306 RepID=UPI002ED89CD0
MLTCRTKGSSPEAEPPSVAERWQQTLRRQCPPLGARITPTIQPVFKTTEFIAAMPGRPLPGLEDNEGVPRFWLCATHLVDGLVAEAEIETLKVASGLYVAENQQEVRRQAAARPDAPSQGMPDSFRLTTLFQLLTWKELAARSNSGLSEEACEALDFFDSAHVKTVGKHLVQALGWHGAADQEEPDALVASQLVWKVLRLELESWTTPRPGWIAGYEYEKTDNWGRSCQRIRQDLLNFLAAAHRSLEGRPLAGDAYLTLQKRRAHCAALLALRILAPQVPELAVRRLHKHLSFGSTVWVNFKHGVDLAEAIEPGSSQGMRDGQLIALPALKSAEATSDEQRALIVATRLKATLIWAAVNHVLPRSRPDVPYSADQIEAACGALDTQTAKAVNVAQTLARPLPLRSDFAAALINGAGVTSGITQALADAGESVSRYEYLYPCLGFAHKRWGNVWVDTAFRLHHRERQTYVASGPRLQRDARTLLDLYMSGERSLEDWRIPGSPLDDDVERPSLQRKLLFAALPDLDTRFKAHLETYIAEQKKAYSALIISLLAGLRLPERIAIERGTITLYSLRQESDLIADEETEIATNPFRGRRGFVMKAEFESSSAYYEVFPHLMIIRLRQDLQTLQVNGELVRMVWPPSCIEQIVTVRRATSQPFNWSAFRDGSYPGKDVHSRVIAEPLGQPIAAEPRLGVELNDLPCPFASTKLAAIADTVSSRLFYVDERLMQDEAYEKTSTQEQEEQPDPAIWLLKKVIPFWQAIEDLNSGSRDKVVSGIIGIGVDVITLGIPLGKFIGGSARLASQAVRTGFKAALPGFTLLTKQLITSTLAQLNPLGTVVVGLRMSGRVGVSLTRASVEKIRLGIIQFRRAGNRLTNKTGSYDLVGGLPQVIDAGGWKPLSNLDELGSVNGVGNVVVRKTGTAASPGHHLINPASGKPYGPPLEITGRLGEQPMFRVPLRVKEQLDYVKSGRGAGKFAADSSGLGKRITDVDEYDQFVARHNIFQGKDQIKADMRAEISAGAEIHVHVRKNGSKTLLRKDSDQSSYIDLATNKKVDLVPHYDYRTLKTWKVSGEAGANAGVTELPVSAISLDRTSLDPPRLASVKAAIENGAYLPAIKVAKTGNVFSIVDGNHRLQAALDLKLEKVPVIIHVFGR